MGKAVLTILRTQWDRVAALTALLLGALALLNGWFGVSGASLSTEQMPYIVSGGLVGLFLLGVAVGLWLSADLRDEWRMLADIDERLEAIQDHLGAAAAGSIPASETDPGDAAEPSTAATLPNAHTPVVESWAGAR